jgi:catechol 2,3-dioxygenase-like lactoylglutathione lyase family enzyme
VSRVQLALNVSDIDEAVSFYSRLFGAEPAKRRPGYANFAIAEAGLASVDERGTTCCYARQDKFWVEGAPDGASWEVYTVLGDSPTFYGAQDGPSCCGGTGESADAASPAAPCC